MPFALESLKYKRGELTVIDQLKLPAELEYLPVRTAEDAWQVIRAMQVRGAPLIAIVAALGLAVHVSAKRASFPTVAAAKEFLLEKIEYLRTSRPTAVNLFVATDELRALVESSSSKTTTTVQSLTEDYILAAESMLSEDIATNKRSCCYTTRHIA
jgi:methylthioribose-1-phosphate isomerase